MRHDSLEAAYEINLKALTIVVFIRKHYDVLSPPMPQYKVVSYDEFFVTLMGQPDLVLDNLGNLLSPRMAADAANAFVHTQILQSLKEIILHRGGG